MLLLTIGLVLVGFVLLVIGIVTETTFLFYVSIAFSVIAGLVLLVSTRLSRREAPVPAGMAPARAPGPPPPPPAREPVPAMAGATGAEAAEPTTERVPVSPPPPPPPRRDTTGPTPFPPPPPAGVTPGDEEPMFPIADYDELRVSEILPLLPELDLDELDMVRDREERGKNRAAVLDRIDELIDELEGEEVEVAPVGAVADDFPIPGYDTLTAEEILPLLPDLEDDELDMVAEREEQGQNRAVILDAIDDMFEEVEVDVLEEEPAVALPPPTRAPAKKLAAKKLAAKKVAAKKVTAKKVTAKKVTAKKVTAKKVPAGVAVGKRAPVKKVGVKKLGAKKVSAKKVGVKKLGGVKKLNGVKKLGVKKLTVKKAGKATKSL